MRDRWGLGPVFAYESVLNARRWQVYAGRSAFVLALLAGMAVVWIGKDQFSRAPGGGSPTIREMAAVGEGFFYALAGIQIALVMLAAPAATAGSMGMDRARGSLLHMMMTDLSDAEIVLGMLGARLAPVLGMIACGVPVAALAALLGGIDFGSLAGAFAVSVALAVLGCSLAMTISIWTSRAHEVLMAVYAAEGVWALALPIWSGLAGGLPILGPPAWFEKANPYALVFAPYFRPGFVDFADFARFVAAVLVLSSALIGLSIARLRRVVVGSSGRPSRAAGRRRPALARLFPSWTGPTLEGNPVLWREWHRNRPSRLAARLWVALLIATWALAAWGTHGAISQGTGPGSAALLFGLLLQLLFGLLMISVLAPLALAEERASGSLDVLLTTPMTTRAIVLAKWWGAYRWALVLLPMPLYAGCFLALTAVDFSFGTGMPQGLVPLTGWDRLLSATCAVADFLASCALIVSLGLILATWVHRTGRAIALNVVAYFLIGIGWIFLLEFGIVEFLYSLSNQFEWISIGLASLSPVWGPLNAIEVLESQSRIPRTRIWVGIGLAILIKAAIAWLLLRLTIGTFDRRLGRVSEARSPVVADRAARPSGRLAAEAT